MIPTARRRAAAGAAAIVAATFLGLTACHGSNSTASGPAGSGASGTTSSTASAPASPSVAVTTAAEPTAPAVTAGPTTGAATPRLAASATATATATAAAVVPATCQNLSVPAGVTWAVAQTWANSKGIAHIQAKPGAFYYGSCGTTLYAATRFEAAPGATSTDLVQLQDEGSVLQFFRFTPSTGWAFLGSDSYPPTDDCSAFAPAALTRQWHCH